MKSVKPWCPAPPVPCGDRLDAARKAALTSGSELQVSLLSCGGSLRSDLRGASSSDGLLVHRANSSSRADIPLRQLSGFLFLFLLLLLLLLVFFLLVQDSSSAPLPTFLVAGGSLAFGTLLCVGIVLR